ncbi:tRNA lysidine(34) synthetase TilS [Nostocoides australiense]
MAALADLAPDDLVLVACSGGTDSLSLVAATAWAAERLSLRAGAVCVDHGLQAGSPQVAARAAEACRRLGLDPVEVVPVEVPADSPDGPEAAARLVRYAALATCADRLGAVAVLLGHTSDDQAEQVLLGLVRGSGIRSLAGIPPRRGEVRRPFLEISRAQTHASCDELGLVPWQDPHNDDPAYLRVRVRRALIDLTADLGPGVRAGLVRTAALARQDADYLDALAADARRALGDLPWEVGDLIRLDPALRTRVWRAALTDAGVPAGALGRNHIAECERLLTAWAGQGPIPLPGGYAVTRRSGQVSVSGPHTVN